MLARVRKLEPGCALRIREGRVAESWRFWSLPYEQEIVDWPVADMIVQVRKYLRRAVERQLVSDVPVGAFLSGGLDSSSVVALARRALGGGARLPCFTIGFRESSRAEGMAEDLPHAQRVAKHLDVELHTIYVGPEMLEELNEGFSSTSTSRRPTRRRSTPCSSRALARQHGIQVLLSGAGGDDVFTGYRRHHALTKSPGGLAAASGAARAAIREPARPPASDLARRIGKASASADLPPTSGSPLLTLDRPGRLRPPYGPSCCTTASPPNTNCTRRPFPDSRLRSSPPLLYLEKRFLPRRSQPQLRRQGVDGERRRGAGALPRSRAGHARGAAAPRGETARADRQVGAAARDGALRPARGDRAQEDGIRRPAARVAAP